MAIQVTMKTSRKGIDFIKREEGLRLTAYKCAANKWTIGYGHTGIDVYAGLVISQDTAEQLLKTDLKAFEDLVNKVQVGTLLQHQFDALMSLIFNIGGSAFLTSTVLKELKNNDIQSAGLAFLLWNKITVNKRKVVSTSLVRRRHREMQLFLTGTYE